MHCRRAETLLFERELGDAFGLVMIVPFLLLALAGAVLSLVGLVLLWKGRERSKGSSLLAAAVALGALASADASAKMVDLPRYLSRS